jgi:hypothetical protein
MGSGGMQRSWWCGRSFVFNIDRVDKLYKSVSVLKCNRCIKSDNVSCLEVPIFIQKGNKPNYF